MKDKAAHREYMREWVRKRRAEYMRDKSCVDCGSRERLEVDHVDPATKVSHRIWSWAAARREAELAKCVVRCRSCHERKSIAERKPTTRPLKPCGTDAAYKRGCRCPECRAAHAVAWKPGTEAVGAAAGAAEDQRGAVGRAGDAALGPQGRRMISPICPLRPPAND